MKKLLKISFAFLLVLGFASCEEDSDTLTGGAATGGFLSVETQAVSYIQGSASTDLFFADLSVFQGREKVESVSVYKQFFRQVDPATLEMSNKVLFTTFSFPVANQHETQQISFDYDGLIADIVFDGGALPADDSMLLIGDYWRLTYVAHLTDGTTMHLNVKSTKVTVSCGSFLAGNYAWGTRPVVVTALGGGTYSASYLPRFSSTYSWVFSDVCGDLTITDWQFQGSNPITGTLTPMPHGVINPDGSLTFTGVNVGGVSWYVDQTWTITPN